MVSVCQRWQAGVDKWRRRGYPVCLVATNEATASGPASSTLAERLSRALTHSGFNQREVETKAGLSKGYLSRLVGGERARVDAGRLQKIATATGVDFAWLSTGAGPMLAPFGAAPTESASPETRVERDDDNPFEAALAEAFRAGEYALSDLDAVRALLRHGATLLRHEVNLSDAAGFWLRAAAMLREEGRPVTVETLVYRMALGTSPREAQSLEARSARLNQEAQESLRKLGGKSPDKPVLPPKRR